MFVVKTYEAKVKKPISQWQKMFKIHWLIMLGKRFASSFWITDHRYNFWFTVRFSLDSLCFFAHFFVFFSLMFIYPKNHPNTFSFGAQFSIPKYFISLLFFQVYIFFSPEFIYHALHSWYLWCFCCCSW